MSHISVSSGPQRPAQNTQQLLPALKTLQTCVRDSICACLFVSVCMRMSLHGMQIFTLQKPCKNPAKTYSQYKKVHLHTL